MKKVFGILTVALSLVGTTASAWEFGTIATISNTTNNHLCVFNIDGDADDSIDCPAAAPFVSNTGYVGIGTTDPITPLHLQADNDWPAIKMTVFGDGYYPSLSQEAALGTASTPLQVTANKPLGYLSFSSYDGSDFQWTGSIIGKTSEDTTATNRGMDFIFQSRDTGSDSHSNKMIIRGNGTVGIGTMTPTHTLTVSGTTWTKILELDTVTGAAVPVSVSSDLSVEQDPEVGTLASGKWCTSDGSQVNCTSDTPAGSDNLGDHTATQALDMSGNNITNAGNIASTGDMTGATLTTTGDITTATNLNAAQICDESGANCTDISAGFNANASGASGAIQFSDGTNLASDEANLFWDDTNNRLGIGTATPSTLLQVSNTLYVTEDGTVSVKYNLGADGFNAYNSTTATSGAVYGTMIRQDSAPAAAATTDNVALWVKALHSATADAGINELKAISANIQNADTTTVGTGKILDLALSSNAGTFTDTYGLYIGDLTAGTQTNTPYSIYASDAGTLNYFAGNVGIGTDTPVDTLSVNGNITIKWPGDWASESTRTGLYFGDSGNYTKNWGIDLGQLDEVTQSSTDDALMFRIYSGRSFAFLNENDTIAMEIASGTGNTYIAGNVGIGTSTPGAKLDVIGAISGTIVGTDTLCTRDGLTCSSVAALAGSGSPWSLNGNDVYYNTGNVGVGTDTPEAALHISSTAYTTLHLENGAGNTRLKLEGGPDNSIAFYSTGETALATISSSRTSNGAGDLVFSTDDGTTHIGKMIITHDGNIGVGSGFYNPSETLHVDGAVQIAGAAKNGCADSDDYGKIQLNSSTGKLQICKP